MEAERIEMCKSLIEWFKVLNLSAPHQSIHELSDGVALAQALNKIAPENFSESWLSKIKGDVTSNWRLKLSNLKKVIEGVYDYYTDVLNLTLTDFPRPDTMRLVEKSDLVELGRLLQLVLGCAVNCNEKQTYITQIMELEESLQRNIMKALQDLESAFQGNSPSRSSLSIANFDLKIVQEERDALAQKCFEGEKQIALLLEEKSILQQEVGKLQHEIDKLEHPTVLGEDGMSIGPVQPGSTRYNDLRRQLDALKDDLMMSETTKEDFKIKIIHQDKEISTLQAKIDELTQSNSELGQLKDELDILREASDKLKICEAQLVTYKKKLEDYNDLKKEIKMYEERSAEYLRQNTQYEEEAKKYSTLKGQVDLYKKEIGELHSKLDTEMEKNVKLEFESKNFDSKITTLQREKDNLLNERDTLRETVDELKCGQSAATLVDGSNTGAVMKELMSPSFKEKITRLEAENKALREGQGGQTALAQLLNDANKRNETLRGQLKSANERILSLTQAAESGDSNLKESELAKQLKQVIELNEQKASQLDEAHSQIATYQTKLSQVETVLHSREQDLSTLEVRYKKCVERAKTIIQTLDPKIAIEASNILEKTPEEQDLQQRAGAMSQAESRLIASAFYRLGMTCQRDAVDAKLAFLMGQGQSFLGRQRQSVPRKPPPSVNPNRKL